MTAAMITGDIGAEMISRAAAARERNGVTALSTDVSSVFYERGFHATILVEMNCGTGFTIKHNELKYQHYLERVQEELGCGVSSHIDDDGCVDSLVELTEAVSSAPGVWEAHNFATGNIPSNVPFLCAGARRLGAFEVYMVVRQPGKPDACYGLHSKLWTRRWPSVSKLTREAQRALEGPFRQMAALRTCRRLVADATGSGSSSGGREASTLKSALHEYGDVLPLESRAQLQQLLDVCQRADKAIRAALSTRPIDAVAAQRALDEHLVHASSSIAAEANQLFADVALRDAPDQIIPLTAAMERFEGIASAEALVETAGRLRAVYDEILHSTPNDAASLRAALESCSELANEAALEKTQARLASLEAGGAVSTRRAAGGMAMRASGDGEDGGHVESPTSNDAQQTKEEPSSPDPPSNKGDRRRMPQQGVRQAPSTPVHIAPQRMDFRSPRSGGRSRAR